MNMLMSWYGNKSLKKLFDAIDRKKMERLIRYGENVWAIKHQKRYFSSLSVYVLPMERGLGILKKEKDPALLHLRIEFVKGKK